MTKRNPFLWPKGATLVIRDRQGEICRSSDRRFDLADAIMLRSTTSQKTVRLSVILTEPPTENLSENLERLICYDIEFDGYKVNISQLEPEDSLASYEWTLKIVPLL